MTAAGHSAKLTFAEATPLLRASACAALLAVGCHATPSEPSDHAHLFAATDRSSECWALHRQVGRDLFPDDAATSITQRDCYPLFISEGTLGWAYNVTIPRGGTFIFGLTDVHPNTTFTAGLSTCGCTETCAPGTLYYRIGTGPAWQRDLSAGSYCLTVFPASSNQEDVYVTVHAERP